MLFQYVQIGCKDLKKLTNFYEKVLDFKKTNDTSWLHGKKGLVYEAPGFKGNKVLFGFYEVNNGAARAINDRGTAHIAFETVDVKGAVARLVKYGGTFQSTMDKPLNAPCVYCKDIEGNIVEFHIPFPSEDCNPLHTVACLLHLHKDKGIRKELGHSGLRFIHVNYITEDYRRLCDFFNTVVGSSDTGKIKDHSGKFKEGVIGIENVHVLGKHILLPGFYKSYPTIEIFQYSIKGKDTVPTDNELGINLIGFKSDNLEKDLKLFVDNGGKLVKKLSETQLMVQDYQGDLIILSK